MRLTSRSGPAERLRGFILVILWAKTAGLSARRQRYAPRIASLGRLLPKKAHPSRGQDAKPEVRIREALTVGLPRSGHVSPRESRRLAQGGPIDVDLVCGSRPLGERISADAAR